YGLANYQANQAGFNSSVFVNTPLTVDDAGTLYFGFTTQGSSPALPAGGVARIDANGNGSYVLASAAAADGSVHHVPLSAAPAVSNDGASVYVSVVSGSSSYYAYLLKLNSATL